MDTEKFYQSYYRHHNMDDTLVGIASKFPKVYNDNNLINYLH